MILYKQLLTNTVNKEKKGVYYFFLITLFLSINLFADVNQRILDELKSPVRQVPLKNALGKDAYNNAISSAKYRFVGNSKCRLCHRKFFIGRKQDPHDKAMKSLIETGYETNPRCLICHSTGYGVTGGFTDMQKTPRLANVQCEGCHGPGNIHIKLAKTQMKNKKKFISGGFLAGQDNPDSLKKMCVNCHTPRWDKSYHDLNEAYNSYKKANPNSKYK
jgi:hypothetical protein